MGISVAEKYPEAKTIFDRASQVLGWDLFSVCRDGPDEKLRETNVAQPALYVTGCAAAAALGSFGISLAAAAGHSIGEYAALASAGVFDFATGLKLVQERGRLMQSAAQKNPGGMAAILGLSRDALQTLCLEIAAESGVCIPVNINSPEQIVVAGSRQAIEKLVALAPQRGAKRVIPLNVSGAFHSPLMKEAADEMRKILQSATFQDAKVPVVMNATAQACRSAGEIKEALARQLDSPVEWVRSIETLKGLGCTVLVECGSGRVLSGLLRRINKELQAHSTETAEALAATISAFDGSPASSRGG